MQQGLLDAMQVQKLLDEWVEDQVTRIEENKCAPFACPFLLSEICLESIFLQMQMLHVHAACPLHTAVALTDVISLRQPVRQPSSRFICSAISSSVQLAMLATDPKQPMSRGNFCGCGCQSSNSCNQVQFGGSKLVLWLWMQFRTQQASSSLCVVC